MANRHERSSGDFWKISSVNKYFFIVARYALYGFMGAEIILLPTIIPEKNAYGDVEYFKAFIVLVPLLLMGFHSGYLRTCYVDGRDLRGALLLGGALLLIPIALGSAFYFQNAVLFFACLASGMGLFVEKIYQRDERFILSLFFKPLVAVFNILLIFIAVQMAEERAPIPYLTAISLSYALALALFMIPLVGKFKFQLGIRRLIGEVRLLISNGFWLNMGTVCLQLFLFTDRTYLRQIDANALSDYSFAFNISQVLFIFFTSISYLNEVKLGAIFRDFQTDQFWHLIRRQFSFLIIGVLLVVIGFEGLLQVYPEFAGGRPFLLIIAPAWGFFFAAGALGVIAQYIGVQKQLSLIMVGLLVLNMLIYFSCSQITGYLTPLNWILKSGIIIAAYTFFMLWTINKKLRKQNV